MVMIYSSSRCFGRLHQQIQQTNTHPTNYRPLPAIIWKSFESFQFCIAQVNDLLKPVVRLHNSLRESESEYTTPQLRMEKTANQHGRFISFRDSFKHMRLVPVLNVLTAWFWTTSIHWLYLSVLVMMLKRSYSWWNLAKEVHTCGRTERQADCPDSEACG